MLKKIICMVMFLMAIMAMGGCTNEDPISTFNSNETIITETIITETIITETILVEMTE